MEEMKNGLRRLVGFILAIFIIYLGIRYWTTLENLFLVMLGAGVPLIIGCVIAYAVNILMNWYEGLYEKYIKVQVALKVKRIVCMIFAILTLFAFVILVINLVLPELINCIASFIMLIPGAIDVLVEYIGEDRLVQILPEIEAGFHFSDLSAEVENLIKTLIGGVGGVLGSVLSMLTSAVSVVIDVVIGFVFALYLLLEKEHLCKQSKVLINTYLSKSAEKIFYVTRVLNESFHSFIVGQCVEAVILGALCIIGMWILGLPYAVMIGVFIGFTALIPIVGAYLGAIVGVVMILTVSPFKAIQFLIFIVILQQLEGNLIYPKVVGKSIGLPGIWVLTAVTIGGGVLGIGGMLLAVPLFAAAYRLIKEDVARRNPVEIVEVKNETTVEKDNEEEQTLK